MSTHFSFPAHQPRPVVRLEAYRIATAGDSNRLTHHDALFLLRSARATGLRQMTDCARPLLHYPCGSQSAGKHLGQVPGNLAEAEPFRKVHVC